MPDQPISGPDAARALAERIYHAVSLVPADNTGLSRHAVWDCQQLMKTISLRHDMTPQEVMAFATILAGANERKLARSAPSGPGVTGVLLEDVLGVDGERPPLRIVS